MIPQPPRSILFPYSTLFRSPEQLSVAVTDASLARGTSDEQATALFAGNTVIIGAMLSFTLIVCDWLVTLPQMSVACYVRVILYFLSQVPVTIASASCEIVTT